MLSLRIENIKDERIEVFKYPHSMGKIDDYLISILQKKPLNGDDASRTNTATVRVDDQHISVPLDAQQKQLKSVTRRNKKGIITDFVKKHADLSADAVKESHRLMEIANQESISTTQSSLYQTIHRLKKEGKTQDSSPIDPLIVKTLETPMIEEGEIDIEETQLVSDDHLNDMQPQSVVEVENNAGIMMDTLREVSQLLPDEKTPTLLSPASISDERNDTKVNVIQPRFVRPHIQSPSEAVIAQGAEWFDPHISVWVHFIVNPNFKMRDDAGKKDQSRLLKKWIGSISGRSDPRLVLPDNSVVESILEKEFIKNEKLEPFELPCFLVNRGSTWRATKIDYSRKKTEGYLESDVVISLEKRLMFLESKCMQLEGELKETRARSPQDMIVVFDYQNFYKSCENLGVFIHPGQIVHDAAVFNTENPRRIIKVVVVDFEMSRHGIWKKNKHFVFYKVEKTDSSMNPTDQVIYQATLETIEAEKLKRGSLVVIVSSDHHFIPLLYELESKGLETMLIGNYPGDISPNVMGKATYYKNIIAPTKIVTKE